MLKLIALLCACYVIYSLGRAWRLVDSILADTEATNHEEDTH